MHVKSSPSCLEAAREIRKLLYRNHPGTDEQIAHIIQQKVADELEHELAAVRLSAALERENIDALRARVRTLQSLLAKKV